MRIRFPPCTARIGLRALGLVNAGLPVVLRAGDGLPDVVRVPAGAGKTGVILAWLWRRLHGQDPAGMPRRLVYALPQRAVLDEVAGSARTWLANLGLTELVALHVVLGDRGAST